MRSLYKISLAVLAMAFLIAGSAFAQDAAKPTLTLTGDVGAAFGVVSFDKSADAPASGLTPVNTKAFSEYFTSWESNLRWTWKTDELTVMGRARLRGNAEGSGLTGNVKANNTNNQAGTDNAFQSSTSDWFTEAWWTPGAFKLGIGKFEGQAWSAPMSGNYILSNRIGDAEYWFVWTGMPGIDAEYNLGSVQLGVAISTVCKPSCNNAVANASQPSGIGSSTTAGVTTYSLTSSQANSEDNTSTIAPHATGSFGAISFRAQFPQTQGTINNHTASTATAPQAAQPLAGSGAVTDASTSKTVTGSGYQIGVAWAGMPGMRVGFDLAGFNEPKVAELNGITSATRTIKDRDRSSIGLRVDVPAGPGTFNLAYFTIDDNAIGGGSASGGKNIYTTTNTTLRYYYPVSFGQIVPEYRSVTNGGAIADASLASTAVDPKRKDTTDSEFRLIIKGLF